MICAKKMFSIREGFILTMMVTMLFMVTVIVDGIYYFGRISEWWFHASYFLTLWYFYKATKEQHASFKGSTEIVLEMTKKERDAVNTDPS